MAQLLLHSHRMHTQASTHLRVPLTPLPPLPPSLQLSAQEKLLKQFSSGICAATLTQPLSTPCGHNFCKPCLDKKFEGIQDIAPTNRTMRVRVNPKPCPRCKADLAQFMASAQVNR